MEEKWDLLCPPIYKPVEMTQNEVSVRSFVTIPTVSGVATLRIDEVLKLLLLLLITADNQREDKSAT